MNMHCYQKLYESAMAYGIRKSLIITNEKQKLEESISNVTDEIEKLESDVRELESMTSDLIDENENDREREKREHEEEVQTLKKKNQRLKEEMEKKLTVSE